MYIEEFLYYLNFLIEIHRDLMIFSQLCISKNRRFITEMKVPGRCIGYSTHPPQTRTCGTPASGSSVPTLLTSSETK